MVAIEVRSKECCAARKCLTGERETAINGRQEEAGLCAIDKWIGMASDHAAQHGLIVLRNVLTNPSITSVKAYSPRQGRKVRRASELHTLCM